MITRSEKQFIGFVLLITAFYGWAWIVLETPIASFSQTNAAADYFSQLGCIQGPYFWAPFPSLIYQLVCLLEIGAVVLIGICFIWLAYQSFYYLAPYPIRDQHQPISN